MLKVGSTTGVRVEVFQAEDDEDVTLIKDEGVEAMVINFLG